ncbi:uncharacterized protein CcaverHIS019_0206200 [Cutaneotrichosporon cavernicola]|uniref:Uncharacterized protein n=1 Tax=Cutaneotrichosporon cavernicola TaxID=279322 RepID=A0AA48L2K4_9TREE|nr:uncharacterized protein CcaverHIS019_0206200 [Cutaneotrichosporon cavernicola]BEI89258.1 hypothetical protein CcaverHIS019_0206200 [Cutaneotrichosporon cavernicola]BEI97034.1 hypothetical protein CcaverHIS631_0206230 [Cutaneotrichosporon cavernicola]BEJ04808.1 hypothetical protein CcaverHIS641_0206250 [Cutaneotrichosporon cavernicola]
MADPELQALVHPHPCRPLQVRAAELIREGVGIYLAPPVDELDITHELGSTLYALHIVERHDRARGSARAAAFRASESVRTRAALRDHALACLDAALEYVSAPGDELKDEDDDDVLLISRPLPVNERYTTIAALLSHHTTPGAVIAHPLIRAALPRAWSRSRRSQSAPIRTVRALLDHAITPARAHVFELASHLVFIALTLVTALVPDIDVGGDTSEATTIVWIVWSWAFLMHILVDAINRRRGPSSTAHLFLMLPACVSGVLMPGMPGMSRKTTQLGTLLRCISIPCSALAIVTPSGPSLPFLFPSRLLPLSIMLAGILARGAKAAALLVPLAGGLWALYAYALNGNVWRAGPNAVPSAIEMASTASEAVRGFMKRDLSAQGGGPIEVGAAPFETRVALLVTLVLVIILSGALSILRAMAPSNELHDGTWEAEYGAAIGHASRRALAAGVARYLPPSSDSIPPPVPLPIPLNILVLPFDALAGAFRILRHGKEPPYTIRAVRGGMGLLIVAIPCLVLGPIAMFLPHW